MAFLVEVVVDVGVDRGALLEGPHPPEPEHRSLSSTERQVALLGPVVSPAAYLLLVRITQPVHLGAAGT